MRTSVKSKAIELKCAFERVKLLSDAAPMLIHLWDMDLKMIECNETALKLFGFTDKKEYFERYYELSPEHQADGCLSRKKARALIENAFNNGACASEWTYRMPDGMTFTANALMVCKPCGDSFIVVGYASDLHVENGIIAGIARKEPLHTVKNSADASPSGAEPGSADSCAPFYDIEIGGIDYHTAIDRFGGDTAIFNDVLRSYALSMRPLLIHLRELLANGDFAAYVVAIHGIIGSSYGILAREIGKQAESLEAAAIAGDASAVQAGHKLFENTVESLLDVLERVFGTISVA